MLDLPGTGDILIAIHTITVDGKVVYQGEEWSKAAAIFLRNIQSLATKTATHEIQRRFVQRYGGQHD